MSLTSTRRSCGASRCRTAGRRRWRRCPRRKTGSPTAPSLTARWGIGCCSAFRTTLTRSTRRPATPHATDLSYAVNTVTGEQRQLQIQYDYYGSSRACTVLARTDTDLFLLTSNHGGDQMHYGFQYGIIPHPGLPGFQRRRPAPGDCTDRLSAGRIRLSGRALSFLSGIQRAGPPK